MEYKIKKMYSKRKRHCIWLHQNNSYYNIPFDLIYLILIYYHNPFKFNTEHHGNDLKFINNTIVKKTADFFPAARASSKKFHLMKYFTCSRHQCSTRKRYFHK